MTFSFISFLLYPEALLAFAAFLFLFYTVNRHHRGSPIDWPVVHMLPGLLANFHRVHDFVTDVLTHCGCTFLLKGPWGASMNFLITADPANVNHIFNTNFANYPKGREFAEIFDVLGSGIFNADGEEWKMQRKITHSLMAEQRFRRFGVETATMKLEKGLLPILDKAAEDGMAVDLQDLFLRFTFDTTCILVMGVDPGCLTPSLPFVPFASAMEDAEEIIAIRHVIPISFWKLLHRLNLLHEHRLSLAWRTIDRYVNSYISDPPIDSHASILSSIAHDDRCNSPEFLRDTAVNLMLAGRDTTAAGLSWFFYLVSKHPQVLEKIVEELRLHYTAHEGALPLAEDLGKMVYLHAAMLETLRLYPPVPFEHKRAMEEETLPSGHHVTPEMRVIIPLYTMARMEGVWGVECREFRPERWIGDKGRLRHEPSYKFLSFNSGPRTCLGKDMALTQMKTIAGAVLRRYEVEVVEKKVEPKVSIILQMKNGMMVKVRRKFEVECS